LSKAEPKARRLFDVGRGRRTCPPLRGPLLRRFPGSRRRAPATPSQGDADRAPRAVRYRRQGGPTAPAMSPPAHHHACPACPPLLERIERQEPAMTFVRGTVPVSPPAFHHVPELSELGERLTRQLGTERAAELTSSGSCPRPGGRRELDARRASHGPATSSAGKRAMLDQLASGRREIEVLKLGGGWPQHEAISPRSCSSRRRPQITTSSTSTRRSARPIALRLPAGRWSTRSSRNNTPR